MKWIILLGLVLLAGCSEKIENKVQGEMQVKTLSWGKFNYAPEVITVTAGQPVRIVADTERLTGCFRSFVIPELGVDKTFTEIDNKVEFVPGKKGTYAFGCSMGMGRGTLVVE